ncbi:Ion channel [Ekhidna lutea]|uniref:Ion channel n=1 Tax=Ekhidna lutea TaxID=447679 RepID=A0A239F520_EKHLU|nr:ion channel [Ekhidna lutea]SNS51262.1 Ion channel [Ekhidna lutea]
MRLFLLLFLWGIVFPAFSQKNQISFTEYSFTELIELIEAEESEVFTLENALIRFQLTDTSKFSYSNTGDGKNVNRDTIHIYKKLDFKNVQWSNRGFRIGNGWIHVDFRLFRFHETVRFEDAISLSFSNSVFDKIVRYLFTSKSPQIIYSDPEKIITPMVAVDSCVFKEGVYLSQNGVFDCIDCSIYFTNNKFYGNIDLPGNDGFYGNIFRFDSFGYLTINNCYFDKQGVVWLQYLKGDLLSITNNTFNGTVVLMLPADARELEVSKNHFKEYISMDFLTLNVNNSIDWTDLENKLISFDLVYNYLPFPADIDHFNTYYNEVRIQDSRFYKAEIKLMGQLYQLYKSQHDNEFANGAFLGKKDLETKRLAYVFSQNPSFDTFFTWKINQFLRLFSDYGTKPSKAIIFGFYVILFFALIYLFFPNSWDSHGRMRIIDRYKFFLKYLNRTEGASEVYQEEKEKELLPFHEFRDYLEQQGKTAPKFFYSTALPLYKWSVSGSRLSGWFLSKIDVLNGKWSEVPEKGRLFKSALVIGAFLIALTYDLFIKVLNAVMLSINTFTTLGFGEIPIKGLPRYLAIIQGFIGWFMLTIFSVSLISQLLN